jgi:hypothetical protein
MGSVSGLRARGGVSWVWAQHFAGRHRYEVTRVHNMPLSGGRPLPSRRRVALSCRSPYAHADEFAVRTTARRAEGLAPATPNGYPAGIG